MNRPDRARPDRRITGRTRAFCLCLLWPVLLAGAANAQDDALFAEAADPGFVGAAATDEPSPDFQHRSVRIDFGKLDAARDDVVAQGRANLTLNLLDGVSYRAVVERTTPTSRGYSLSGRLEGVPFGTMAMVVNGDVVVGNVRVSDSVYSIRTHGGAAVVERRAARPFREHPPLKPVAPRRSLDSRIVAGAAEDDGSEIDVFVVWTRQARKDAGGVRHIQTAIDLAVVETNDAYAASDAVQRIRLAGAVEVNYAGGSGSFSTNLTRLINPSDGYMDEVHALRDTYAADLVQLVQSGVCGGGGVEGIAVAMEEPSADFAASAFSVSVFCDQSNLLSGISPLPTGLRSDLFAHELGHNMGLQHDRYARYTTLNKPYPYSHGYVNQRAFADGAEPGARWQTIMAYDDQCGDAGFFCASLMRFSNPNQRYPNSAGDPLGKPGNAPSEDVDGPADAVRSLDNTRRIVANFRRSETRCTYRLARDSVTVAASGGSFAVGVSAADACTYEARSHDEFLSVPSASRSESGQVHYEVAPNDGYARVGAISVAGETLVVRQQGVHAVADVCRRTPAIRDAITAWAGGDDCSGVTVFDLSQIPYLLLEGRGIASLRIGDFSGLSGLRTLDLSFNDIAGELPADIGELESLERLDLHSNRLAGPIPPELGGLRHLKSLKLSFNRFEGPIPEDLSRLGDLRQLNLRDNRLTGAIPGWLDGLTKLSGLALENNQLEGAIPVALGRIAGLAGLSLANNALTGSIPPEIGGIDNLQNLDLSGNRLAGPIPAELGRLSRLATLHLYDNGLTGDIPVALGGLPWLQALTLRNNRLTGTVPAELTDLTRLHWLELSGNALRGCIPGALHNVRYHDLDELGLRFCATVGIPGAGFPGAPNSVARIKEGGTAAVVIAVDPAQEGSFDVAVELADGDGFGVDAGRRTLRVSAGTTMATLTVETVDDDVEEPDGGFTATIVADDDYAVFASRSSARVLVDDDEGPTAPTIVSLTPEDGTLTIAWAAPAHDGGSPIVAYDIRYRPVAPPTGHQGWSHLDRIADGVLQRDITGLTNRVEYQVQVRAIGEDGDGAWSEIVTGTPRACPDGIEIGDCRTLLAVRDQLAGGGHLNWDIERPVAEWTGVRAGRHAPHRVQTLYLPRQALSGTIPPELGRLSGLIDVHLDHNNLTGTLPPELGSLTDLRTLWLGRNRLAGGIPPEWGGLANLEELYLDGNRLTGAIPPELGSLAKLRDLFIRSNDLGGELPAALGQLSNLRRLAAHHNRFTGALPPSFGDLANLETAWLHNNDLTGAIPAEIGRLSNLLGLSLDDNRLTGTMPAELGRLSLLESLHLSNNQLTGAIPRTLSGLANLTRLSLAGNPLTGCVPRALRAVAVNDLQRLGLQDCPPARVVHLAVDSKPQDGAGYGAGERITASVGFETNVTVTGSPQLGLTIGDKVRDATFHTNEDGQLTFQYDVVAGDRDSDGISIAVGALSLNGGVIRDVDGQHAVLSIGEHAISNDQTQKVRGSLRELVPDQAVEPGGDAVVLDLTRYFQVPESGALTYGSMSSDPRLVTVVVANGILTVTPHDAEGVATVTVTATGEDGVAVTLEFRVEVTVLAGRALVGLFPSTRDPMRQGFVRIINQSGETGEVAIEAIDDAGVRAGPVTLHLAANAAVHFNSKDLEAGNAGKGLAGGVGTGTGDWRLVLESELDIEVLSYIRTADGFLTAMHDRVRAAVADGAYPVATFNPASNVNQVSRLRIVNPTAETLAVSVTGVDDTGQSPGGVATIEVPAEQAVTVAGTELESGTGSGGALGDGTGKWRLTVGADRPLVVMSLMSAPPGHITNLSTKPHRNDDGTHVVPVFPSAADQHGREGFVRVVNHAHEAADVTITAYDESDWVYSPLALALGPGETVHFNSTDLELGNVKKGLTGSTGSGNGDWWLELESPPLVDVLAYIRTADGFLTAMHDVVPAVAGQYRVKTFNPGSNLNQRSRLRLVNRSAAAVHVSIKGVDDTGSSPGSIVRLTVPAGDSATLTASELESGTSGIDGALGDGIGKWRLHVTADGPLLVVNLLSSPTGHLTNLSTAPNR